MTDTLLSKIDELAVDRTKNPHLQAKEKATLAAMARAAAGVTPGQVRDETKLNPSYVTDIRMRPLIEDVLRVVREAMLKAGDA